MTYTEPEPLPDDEPSEAPEAPEAPEAEPAAPESPEHGGMPSHVDEPGEASAQ